MTGHALALTALLLMVVPAFAQQPCGVASEFKKTFEREYGEFAAVKGTMFDGRLRMAMFANRATGTWTMMHVRPDGMACIFASGTDVEFLPPVPQTPKGRDL